ncbi:hypothetical protein OIDMADRAFT_46967 [Oidiodendron maius Zn]|uniref:Uncharacterized protein n=1 Tax=Oidiodendron maius (strain Zn) TaxID=913774 RepID=A0A0C3D6U3_OIDMZ|nr:hypothetical protein OIDMADRAFT_46967 [Oidiodendron maius Zn]
MGNEKKSEFKQLPRGYAEVLENTLGQPVIHDLVSRLGCIRPFSVVHHPLGGAEVFAELIEQFQAAPSKMGTKDNGSKKSSFSSPSSSSLEHTEQARNTGSDHAALSRDYQMIQAQQEQPQQNFQITPPTLSVKPMPLRHQRGSIGDDRSSVTF